MDSNSIKVHALLDFGAFVCFMDKGFVDHHKLPLVIKKHLIPVEVTNNRPLISGDVIPLDITLKGYHSIIAFNIIKLP
jgi:hypothetical protein